MPKGLLVLLCLFAPYFVGSQLQFEKWSHDFGNLTADSERIVDIEVKNVGKKKEYFLSFRPDRDLTCLSKGQRIDPDSTTFIRIQVNPKQVGKFNYRVEIYTSDSQEARYIQVKGNVVSLPQDPLAQLQRCPDFNQRPVKSKLASKQELLTRDQETKKLVSAQVYVIQQGREIMQVPTRAKVEQVKIPIGMTHFYATSPGYLPLDTAIFIGLESKRIELELQKKPKQTEPVQVDKEPEITEIEVKPEPARTLEQELKAEETKQSKEVDTTQLASLASDDFSAERFLPVNVVFVVDISGSMQQSDKANLMKYALNQLVDVLRPQDKMGIVTFATNTELLLSAQEKLSKEEIKDKIVSLKSAGSTAGVAGLKGGFEELEKNEISDGRNLLIVITDGSFEMNRQGEKVMENVKNKGYQMSFVGIKTGPTTSAQLQITARETGGSFVSIKRLADAKENLVQEIRRTCFKGL